MQLAHNSVQGLIDREKSGTLTDEDKLLIKEMNTTAEKVRSNIIDLLNEAGLKTWPKLPRLSADERALLRTILFNKEGMKDFVLNVLPNIIQGRAVVDKAILDERFAELKNIKDQFLIGFAKNLKLVFSVLSIDELQLLHDYVQCNGVFNQIANARNIRKEKKANRVSVSNDLNSLIKQHPFIEPILQGIKIHITLTGIQSVSNIDRYSHHATYPQALMRAAKLLGDKTLDDRESVDPPRPKTRDEMLKELKALRD